MDLTTLLYALLALNDVSIHALTGLLAGALGGVLFYMVLISKAVREVGE